VGTLKYVPSLIKSKKIYRQRIIQEVYKRILVLLTNQDYPWQFYMYR
jgi:hypothetical protein